MLQIYSIMLTRYYFRRIFRGERFAQFSTSFGVIDAKERAEENIFFKKEEEKLKHMLRVTRSSENKADEALHQELQDILGY